MKNGSHKNRQNRFWFSSLKFFCTWPWICRSPSDSLGNCFFVYVFLESNLAVSHCEIYQHTVGDPFLPPDHSSWPPIILRASLRSRYLVEQSVCNTKIPGLNPGHVCTHGRRQSTSRRQRLHTAYSWIAHEVQVGTSLGGRHKLVRFQIWDQFWIPQPKIHGAMYLIFFRKT